MMIQQSLLRRSRTVYQSYRPRSSGVCWKSNSVLARTAPLRQRIAPRCYSTADTATDTGSETSAQDLPQSSVSGTTRDTDLELKNREIIDLKDKYLRSVADFRNLQDRTKRDVDAARSFAISRFAVDLMESVDNLDRAIATVPVDKVGQADSNRDLVNLYDGLKMTESIFMQTLRKHGLNRFDPSQDEEDFDPNLHEATFQTKVEGKKDGTVFTTMQKGFVLNGRVIRAAKVGVVKNS